MKRGFKKQISLPFFLDTVEDIFLKFQNDVENWHKFQSKHKSAGNDYYWWSSRFGEWMQEYRQQISTETYLAIYQIFPRIWEKHETFFTRNPSARGVPNSALETNQF